ncbi:M36 family metallopeptidase [Rubrivirga sp.]|uniref:M36 family metallopeptidase n=1 Tax=Rubrivirga sp. TaxID=1885344 RepID=UPI003B521F58
MRRLLTLLALCGVSAALTPSAAAQKLDAQARSVAIEMFRAEQENALADGLEIQVDPLTTTVSALVGGQFPGFTGPPESAARTFLDAHKAVFGFSDASDDLEHLSTRSSGTSTQVLFRQRYRGVPLLYSGYLVAIDRSGAIHFVSGDAYPDVEVDIAPALSASAALSTARSDMGAPEAKVVREPELAIWADETDGKLVYHLVHSFDLETREPLSAWTYLIDAHSGRVLWKTSLLEDVSDHGLETVSSESDGRDSRFAPFADLSGEATSSVLNPVSGSGNVYASNPLHGSPVSKPLFRLQNLSPRRLDGEHLWVDRYNAADVTSSNAVFNYAPTDARFDEVMVYHHGDMFEGAFLSPAGLPVNQVAKIKATTQYYTGYAFAYSSLGEIYFQSGASGLNNPTKEAAVIVHEYMHVVSETYNALTYPAEADAMDEGYSDYFGIAYRRSVTGAASTVFGEYIDQPGGTKYTRDLVNNANYAQFNIFPAGDFDGSGGLSPHDGGMILSGALWAFRMSSGVIASNADAVVLESLKYLGSAPTFLDARNATVTAASVLGFSSYGCAIQAAFAARGIGTACVAPLTASITGPSILGFKEYGTYTCSTSGGSGSPTTRQWSERTPPATAWTAGPTTTTYTIQMGNLDRELRCIVTRGTGTATATKLVTYSSVPPVAPGPTPGVTTSVFALDPPRPNPSAESATVAFSLAEGAETTLVVYDALGREVARPVSGWRDAGAHTATLAVGSLPSGVYVVRLTSGPATATARLSVAR